MNESLVGVPSFEGSVPVDYSEVDVDPRVVDVVVGDDVRRGREVVLSCDGGFSGEGSGRVGRREGEGEGFEDEGCEEEGEEFEEEEEEGLG